MDWKKLQKLEVLLLKAIKTCLRRLLSSLNKSESVKESQKNFDGARIERLKEILLNWDIDFVSQKYKRLENIFIE